MGRVPVSPEQSLQDRRFPDAGRCIRWQGRPAIPMRSPSAWFQGRQNCGQLFRGYTFGKSDRNSGGFDADSIGDCRLTNRYELIFLRHGFADSVQMKVIGTCADSVLSAPRLDAYAAALAVKDPLLPVMHWYFGFDFGYCWGYFFYGWLLDWRSIYFIRVFGIFIFGLFYYL